MTAFSAAHARSFSAPHPLKSLFRFTRTSSKYVLLKSGKNPGRPFRNELARVFDKLSVKDQKLFVLYLLATYNPKMQGLTEDERFIWGLVVGRNKNPLEVQSRIDSFRTFYRSLSRYERIVFSIQLKGRVEWMDRNLTEILGVRVAGKKGSGTNSKLSGSK